jgi:hypothetical protein
MITGLENDKRMWIIDLRNEANATYRHISDVGVKNGTHFLSDFKFDPRPVFEVRSVVNPLATLSVACLCFSL